MEIGRVLIVIGLAIAVLGIVLTLGLPFVPGRLPGDIVIKRGSFTLYLPVVTSILLSLALTIFLWLAGGVWGRR